MCWEMRSPYIGLDMAASLFLQVQGLASPPLTLTGFLRHWAQHGQLELSISPIVGVAPNVIPASKVPPQT